MKWGYFERRLNTIKVIFKLNQIDPCSLRGYKTARGQSWRFEKIRDSPCMVWIGASGRISFGPPTLILDSFEVSWASRMLSTSFERWEQGPTGLGLKKECDSAFSEFFLHSKNPHFNSIYLLSKCAIFNRHCYIYLGISFFELNFNWS